MHVVGTPGGVGQQGVQVDIAGLGLGTVENTLLAEQSDQPTSARIGIGFVVGDDVTHPGLAVVGVRAAEGSHVDVFAGNAAHHVGSGDEDPALRCHHDDVGQCGSICGAAGGEADHHRNLGDVAGCPDHRLEHQAHRVQRLDTLGQSGTAGVPDAHDRTLLVDREVVGIDDVATAVDTHRAAHDGAIGAERNGAQTVDGAGRGQDSGLIPLVQWFDAVVVEEVPQPQQRVTRIECFADHVRGHDGHLYLLVRAGWVPADGCQLDGLQGASTIGSQYFPKAMATLWPPNPNELLMAYR